ncbi:FAD/NAD(P)-binding domain-containing protein [Mycena albidolilacea]|uniref:FAD/NAD(P)-binding domain-containing protein n=1 Tax=Mycena albidolilacea TaxID=1033008 RepID=A0AAD7EJY9_9AGAR|nr:FAD/NAD(P)-binding domain-containing protein [Mycena albidolilacea]
MATEASVPAPLRIFVVGAGLCGLTAAVALRRQGHRIEILESSLMDRDIGAAVTVQANAIRVLEYLGYTAENLKGVDSYGTVRFSGSGGEGKPHHFLIPKDDMGRGAWLCHRTDLHGELKRLAIGEDGAGPPARLHLGQEVVSCDPVTGTLALKNGDVREADLILGCDGIHSIIRTSVLGYVQQALPSGMSTFRCLFDATKLEGLADMEWFTEGMSGGRSVTSPEERYRELYLYPCRAGTLINVVAHHVDDRDQDKHEWNATASVEEVLDEFKSFHPRYLKFLELAEQPILRWQLRALPILPTWINGRTALLGDAAHATLPTLGQGAGMALEDAAAIGCLIQLGTRPEEIPARLEAYQRLRKSRGEFVNRESLEQARQSLKRGLYARSKEMQEFLIGYDAIGTTQKYYSENFSATLT